MAKFKLDDILNLKSYDLAKKSHEELVEIAQASKKLLNKTIDRLYFKYRKTLNFLDVNYIRQRITKDMSDAELLDIITEAKSSLSLNGNDKLGAKSLKKTNELIERLTEAAEDVQDIIEKLKSLSNDDQIQFVKDYIGSEAINYNIYYNTDENTRLNNILDWLNLKDNTDPLMIDYIKLTFM